MAKRIKEEKIRVEIQEQYAPLLSMPEVRYKLYYGGRAGGKSYGFADAKTFQVKARPVEPVDNLRPGMSVLLKRDKK